MKIVILGFLLIPFLLAKVQIIDGECTFKQKNGVGSCSGVSTLCSITNYLKNNIEQADKRPFLLSLQAQNTKIIQIFTNEMAKIKFKSFKLNEKMLEVETKRQKLLKEVENAISIVPNNKDDSMIQIYGEKIIRILNLLSEN